MRLDTTPGYVVSIDPGQSSGLARFEAGRLVFVARMKPDEVIQYLLCTNGYRVVVELPQFYTHDKSKADPNKLAKLVLLVGEYRLAARLHQSNAIHLRHPAAWKGQLPKLVVKERVLRELDDEERACVQTDNLDAIEALGIGLEELGRFSQ